MQKNISIEITSGYVNLNNIVITHPDFAAMSNDEIKQLVIDCELSVNYMTGDLTHGEDLVGKGSIVLGDLEFAMHDDGVVVENSEKQGESFLDLFNQADRLEINGKKIFRHTAMNGDKHSNGSLAIMDEHEAIWVIPRENINNAIKTNGVWDLGFVEGKQFQITLYKMTTL